MSNSDNTSLIKDSLHSVKTNISYTGDVLGPFMAYIKSHGKEEILKDQKVGLEQLLKRAKNDADGRLAKECQGLGIKLHSLDVETVEDLVTNLKA